MARQTKYPHPCDVCGNLTKHRAGPNGSRVCIDCGLTNAARAAREMHDKQGAAWDAFLASNGPQGRRAHRTKERA